MNRRVHHEAARSTLLSAQGFSERFTPSPRSKLHSQKRERAQIHLDFYRPFLGSPDSVRRSTKQPGERICEPWKFESG